MRVRAAIVLLAVLIFSTRAFAEPDVGPGYGIQMSRMIPTRDGTQLEAWIFKPSKLQVRAPTVFTLTQYDIDGSRRSDAAVYTRRGFVFVQVLVRGRGRSGGDKNDNLGVQTGRDGYDVVEWIASQPWSNGQVVMFGGSFVGMSQWRTATQNPPHLAAIAPYVSIYPGWDVPNTNGIPQAWSGVIMGFVAGRSLNTGFIANQEYWFGKMLEHYAAFRPFSTLDDAIGIAPDDWWMSDERGEKKSFMDMWLDHLGEEAFNLSAEPKPADYTKMSFPILTATGFFDDDQPGALRYYRRHVANASPAAVAKHYLVIGPWDHSGTQRPTQEINGLKLPDSAVLNMETLHADWYDWALGRGALPTLLRDRVTYFMMGANDWRYAKTLESASSNESLTFYLESADGTPKDIFHSGRLTPKPAKSQAPAVVVSDPHELPELEFAQFVPSEDSASQFRSFQKRAITFHSDALTEPTEIAGTMRLTLVTQADTPDFDLWAQVSVIRADGSAMRIGEDMRRARFRNGPFKQELLKPAQIVEIPFEFNWTALKIPAGARVRLTVAPLNSPSYQKNFNTGGQMGYEKIEDARIANIKIYHDATHASRLTLPIAAPSSVKP